MWRPITPMNAEKEVSIFRETVNRGGPAGRVVWRKHHMWSGLTLPGNTVHRGKVRAPEYVTMSARSAREWFIHHY